MYVFMLVGLYVYVSRYVWRDGWFDSRKDSRDVGKFLNIPTQAFCIQLVFEFD